MPRQGPDAPSEEELRAALEEQMRKVRVEDLLLQSVASLVNLSARRIAKEDERDLAQAKVGIEAVRALVDLLPEEAAGRCGTRSATCRCSTRGPRGRRRRPEEARRKAEAPTAGPARPRRRAPSPGRAASRRHGTGPRPDRAEPGRSAPTASRR